MASYQTGVIAVILFFLVLFTFAADQWIAWVRALTAAAAPPAPLTPLNCEFAAARGLARGRPRFRGASHCSPARAAL